MVSPKRVQEKKKLYSIGEIARLSQVSIKTLRHYDEIGLFRPAYVDPETSRRYYEEIQLYHLFLIRKLKTLKFSLEEIKRISFDQYFKSAIPLFKDRFEENKEEIERLKKSNQDIENWLSLLNWLNLHDLDMLEDQKVQLKELPERTIAFYPSKGPFLYKQLFAQAMKLSSLIETHKLEEKDWYLFVIHDELREINMENLDMETARMVSDKTHGTLTFIRKIPGGTYLSIVHKGSFKTASKKIEMICKWVEKNAYQIVGPLLALYIVPLGWVKTEDDLVIELQIEVRKSLD